MDSLLLGPTGKGFQGIGVRSWSVLVDGGADWRQEAVLVDVFAVRRRVFPAWKIRWCSAAGICFNLVNADFTGLDGTAPPPAHQQVLTMGYIV